MKFKGNQKQFELNAQIDSVFDRIRSANDSKNNQVDDLVDEGKELIRKRQKLIRIADKSAHGWKVLDEYVSDELASGSLQLEMFLSLEPRFKTFLRIS